MKLFIKFLTSYIWLNVRYLLRAFLEPSQIEAPYVRTLDRCETSDRLLSEWIWDDLVHTKSHTIYVIKSLESKIVYAYVQFLTTKRRIRSV
jgi:hypothetical protein